MANALSELKDAVTPIVENLKTVAERSPSVVVAPDDFNDLLARSKAAVPQSSAIRDLKPLAEATTLATMLLKISILQGALDAESRARTSAALREMNDERRRQSRPW